jgi:hypothetical protein
MTLMTDSPLLAPATSLENLRTASRMARIALRREATPDERIRWGAVLAAPPSGTGAAATLTQQLMALPELAQLALPEQIARACDTLLQRYDAAPPADVAHWVHVAQQEGRSVGDLVGQSFKAIADSGYRSDPCAAPVDASRPLYAVRDAAGAPLVFAVGANAQLYLFRRTGDGWRQLALSAVLPAPVHGHVQSLDLQQAGDGTITIALALCPRRGPAASTVYVAAGVSPALDDAGWLALFASLQATAGAPAGAQVSHLALAPSATGTLPLVLVGAAVGGITNTYSMDMAAPAAPWSSLRIPEDADRVRAYALGRYHRAGVWTLYDVGPGVALTFTAFPDAYGKSINVSYAGLPAAVTSFRLMPGATADVPDVYVAGGGIAVYRAAHDAPEPVAGVQGATIVSVARAAGAEHVVFTDASLALYVVTQVPGGSWGQPVRITGDLEQAVLIGNPGDTAFTVLAVTAGGALEVRTFAAAGAPAAVEEIAQSAVWEEEPLGTSELASAIGAAAPVVYFATDEKFFSSTVELYLRRVGLWNEIGGAWQMPPGSLWDSTAGDVVPHALDILPRTPPDNPKHDSDYVLKIDDADYTALLPGHPDGAPLYVHAKFLPAENATDLIFWIFCPYNGAALLKLDAAGISRRIDLDPLGVHEGDWEHFLVRVDNDTGKPLRYFLSAHDGGAWHEAALLERDDATGRAVLYTSRHGHAFYPTAGDNLSNDRASALWAIGLINYCDRGRRADFGVPGASQLISAGFLGSAAPREPAWLQLPWRWGRYADFSRAEVSGVVAKILAPLAAAMPFLAIVSAAVAEILVDSNALGDEGNSAGPQAIKFKNNWFGVE